MIEVTMEVVSVDDHTIHMESTAGHWCGVVMPDWRTMPVKGERLKVVLDSDDYPVEVERKGEVIWP